MASHITVGLHLRGRLDRQALRKALDRIVARHEVLRTVFRGVEGEPLQVIGEADCGFTLIEQEVSDTSNAVQIASQAARDPFDVFNGPLIRGRLLGISDQEHLLFITQHRLICDDWSIGVLLRELSVLYRAFVLGQGDPLRSLELQYSEYARGQRQQVTEEVFEKQIEFWRRNLFGASELLQLQTDQQRSSVQCYSADRVRLTLSAELTEQLRKLAQQQDVTLFATLLTGWAVLLARWSGQDDLIIGTRVANRQCPETGPLMGVFENTAALWIQCQGDATAEQLLKQIETAMAGASAHQDVPFAEVIKALKTDRSDGPSIQVMMVLTNTPARILESLQSQWPELTLSEILIENEMTRFELSLSLTEGEQGLAGTLEYASDLFERETIERMAACWDILLQGIATDIRTPASQLPILTDIERERVLYRFNEGPAGNCQDRLIHQVFEEHAQRSPNIVSVAYEDMQLTYGELNRRANQLARYLREQGVGPDKIVAICVERSVDMVVAILGVLKAGGAYVPLDPSYPINRLQYMLTRSAPVVLLTQERLKRMLHTSDTRVISVDADWDEISDRSQDNLDRGPLTPEHLAYVIYTSGSTGTPKGVMVEHRNVTRFMSSTDGLFDFSNRDTLTMFHSFSFDFSVLELWGALLFGGQLVIVPHEVTRSPSEFYALLCRERITVLSQTPSAFRQLMDAQARTAQSHVLSKVVLGGEALDVSSLKSWYERNSGQQPQIINMYGPTETTVFVTYRTMEPADTLRRTGGSPIGLPIPHSRIYILDRHFQPAPVGVIGEIYIGGAGVARGYLNQPELTVERFGPDLFSNDPKARVYKTGDLGRWRPDGTLEYVGRNDHQVKIRGYRIELGEIEAQLVRHADVKEALVIAREDVLGEKRLVAYVTLCDELGGQELSNGEALRGHLKAVLPEYMVPSAFVVLKCFPLTPNGKLDRRALPAPEFGTCVSREYKAPQGEVEEVLGRIWQELLRVDRVSREDNLFELGGDSLTAMRLVVRVTERFPIQFHAHSVFRNPTFREMAQFVEAQLSAKGDSENR